MRFTQIYSIPMAAMAVSVYGHNEINTVTDLNDVRPGHIADMSALPYEIVSLVFHHNSNLHQTH
jgi:hypothetical protein